MPLIDTCKLANPKDYLINLNKTCSFQNERNQFISDGLDLFSNHKMTKLLQTIRNHGINLLQDD